MKTQAELYRDLPSVDELLHDPEIAELIAREGQVAVTDACRVVIGNLRGEIGAGRLDEGKLALALSGAQQAAASWDTLCVR
jgi:hypothetical protein